MSVSKEITTNNCEFYDDVYYRFDRESLYELSVCDKFLINKEVDFFVDQYRESSLGRPDLRFSPVFAKFSPSIEQYGFRLEAGYHYMKTKWKEINRDFYRIKGKSIPKKDRGDVSWLW
jgi:hypothetical protein